MTLIAGTVRLEDLLTRLARQRPIFHSEADFQHAFAWEAKQFDPQLTVRLEAHPEPNVRVDLLLGAPDRAMFTFVELKYMTISWAGEAHGESFALKSHGAQDIRGYDVVKDIERLERFVARRPRSNGVFVAVCNDPSYWRPVMHGRLTNAHAYRLYEGVTLGGSHAWGPNTGAGTMRGRESAIELLGSYPLTWKDYSQLGSGRGGTFRSLALEVLGSR